MMKCKMICGAMLGLVMATSCEEALPASEEIARETAVLTVRIADDTQSTKATASNAADEVAIGSVQLFVFDESGRFENQSSSSSSVLELGCTLGRKTIWALVNAPQLNPASVSELLSTVTKLSDNSLGAFVMSGSRTINISGPVDIDLNVKRYVARVSLGRIVNALTGVYSTKEFTLRGVYLIDVAADTSYGLANPASWYNKMAHGTTAADELICDCNLSVAIACGSSSDVEHVFYPYPNPVESNANGGTWSERHTKLVVEASIDGVTCWYPVVLPVIQRNKTYTISEMTITRMGSDDPDIPVDKGSVDFNILVEDWEEGQAPHSETI